MRIAIHNFFILMLLLQGCSSKVKEVEKESLQLELDTITKDWPEASKKAITEVRSKYGEPQEVTGKMVIWYNTPPFKRSIVYKEEVKHLFPFEHSDVLEQVVDYSAPFNKVDDIWKFNGSIILERTKGEMAARGESQGSNISALNLADDIMKNRKLINDARIEFTKVLEDLSTGEKPDISQSLKFSPSENAEDPDFSSIKAPSTIH
jgi:hypothetical protein